MYLEIFYKGLLHEAICNVELSGNNVVTILRQLKTFSEQFYDTQNRRCESSRVTSPLVCDPFLPLSPHVRCRKEGIIHLFSVLDHMETRRPVVLDILYGIQTSSLPEETAKRFKKIVPLVSFEIRAPAQPLASFN